LRTKHGILQLIECRLGRFTSDFFGNLDECEALFTSLQRGGFHLNDIVSVEDADAVWRRAVATDGASRVFLSVRIPKQNMEHSVVNVSVSVLRLWNPFVAYGDVRLQGQLANYLREHVRLWRAYIHPGFWY
jgi:hypothetical protein